MTAVRVHGEQLVLREATEEDRPFIATRWLHSYSAARAGVSARTFKVNHPLLIDRLLDRAGVRCVVACSPRERSAIFGFALGQGADTLHYVYAMKQLWGDGLAKALVSNVLGGYPEIIRCTHAWPWASGRFIRDWYPLTTGDL